MLLAALATLGLVLGPEARLIALGMGLGILAMRLVKGGAPQQALALMAAAASGAARRSPALFLGVVGGLIAADLPGYAETPAVAALTGPCASRSCGCPCRRS